MSRRFFRWVLLAGAAGIFWVPGAGAEESLIRLRDGTVLRGEVLSKDGELYKIKSDTLGVLLVRETEVGAIENTPRVFSEAAPSSADSPEKISPGASGSSLSSPQVQAYQQKIMDDPRIMSKVEGLAQDKEFLDILSDDKVRAAILRQDLEYLQGNEKFMKLLESPTVKEIVGDIVDDDEE